MDSEYSECIPNHANNVTEELASDLEKTDPRLA